MKAIKVRDNREIYDIQTGCTTVYTEDSEKSHYYAVVIKCGHCGNGYFIPIIATIETKNKDFAIDLAKNLPRVKKSNKYSVMGMKEVSVEEFRLLQHINDCDKYLTGTNANELEDLYDRRVIMEEAIMDLENYGKNKRTFNYDRLDIKEAKDYAPKYVLQRYVAPTYMGEKLVYPRNINMYRMLDEYFYYNTFELGIKGGSTPALSLYYQIYGENNPLNIDYDDEYIKYTSENGLPIEQGVSGEVYEYLEKAKQRFIEQRSTPFEEVDIVMASPLEKFYKKYNIEPDERQ